MACEDLLTACFFDERAPLAVPELNRERTRIPGVLLSAWLELGRRQAADRGLPEAKRGAPRRGREAVDAGQATPTALVGLAPLETAPAKRQALRVGDQYGTFFFSRGSAGIRMRPRHAIRYQLRGRPCMV